MQLNEIDMEKRKMLLRDFQNGLTRFQAKENIEEKFGDCVGYGVRTCERWYTKFKSGDFDLTKKPRDKKSKKNSDNYYFKKKNRRSTKTIKVNEVKFKQQELPAAPALNVEKNETVQNLIKSKRELTISKVSVNRDAVAKKPTMEPNIITKRLITSPTRPILFPITESADVEKEKDAPPLEMPNLRPRRPRSKGIEIQLPVSTAKRMTPQTLTENHSIGEGSKQTIGNATTKNTVSEHSGPREVTVQFQNLSPEVAKNTVRKNTKTANRRHTPLQLKTQNQLLKIANVAHVEKISPEKSKTTEQTILEVSNKRTPLQQNSPLTNPKGIIYLNPQEIFRQSFGGFENSLKRQSTYVKSAQQIHKTQKPSVPPHPTLQPPPPEIQDSVILSDSEDSVEDIVFPENISLPAPKIKTDNTYTTYWDMESGEPIPLNPEESILPKPPVTTIEID